MQPIKSPFPDDIQEIGKLKKQDSVSKFSPNLSQPDRIEYDSNKNLDIHPAILQLLVCLQNNTL